jgi:membrane protein DedA with SNARE-associated domain
LAQLAHLLLAWGPVGVLVLSVLDSAGIPLPGGVDALLIFLGAHSGPKAYWSAALAIAGSVIGNAILFYAGRKGGDLYFARRARKPRTERLRRWFRQYGLITVFIPALVPIPLPLKVFVVSAGALGVGFPALIAVVLAARIPRFLAMTYLGCQLGLYSFTYLTDHAWLLAAIAVGLFLLCYGLARATSRFSKARLDGAG